MTLYANWKGILAVFFILCLLLVSYFGWQIKRINTSFREHSLEHSTVLAAVVELNIRNSLTSQEGMETVIGHSLGNTARFIRYLNAVEPFSAQELAAFAGESGLSGIQLFAPEDRVVVSSPDAWLQGADPAVLHGGGLTFLADGHQYLFTLQPVETNPGLRDLPGVVVGMSARDVERIKEALSVDRLLRVLNQMRGIEYVRLEKRMGGSSRLESPETSLIRQDARHVSETRIDMAGQTLIVGLEADYFSRRIETLKKEFLVFLAVLILLGGLSSWLLYQAQQERLEQTRIYERNMARQLEQASLGRATATITHEMRNPLNAISMGLQRIQMEAEALEPDHERLIASMRQAVERINAVITRLLQYVQPFKPGTEAVSMHQLVESLAILYRPQLLENGIQLDLEMPGEAWVTGDTLYLTQAIENLIRNAVEAQPDGGRIGVSVAAREDACLVRVENPARPLKPETMDKLLEPYFTTKPNGTGLGLSISRKIIEAHSGRLAIDASGDRFRITVTLPLATGKGPAGDGQDRKG